MPVSDFIFNVFGTTAATISLLALIPPLVYWFIRHLPRSRLPRLVKLVKEVETLFYDNIEQGLLHQEDELFRLHNRLWTLRMRLDDVQRETYAIHTWKDELRTWYAGLSSLMALLGRDVQSLRETIVQASSRERKALAAAGFTAALATMSSRRDRFSRYRLLASPSPLRSPLALSTDLHDLPGATSLPVSEAFSSLFGSPASAPPAYEGAPPSPPQSPRLPFDGHLCATPSVRLQGLDGSAPSEMCPPRTPAPAGLGLDVELKELLSLALGRNGSGESAERQRELRKEMLCRLSTQLLGFEDSTFPDSDTSQSEQVRTKRRPSLGACGASRAVHKVHAKINGAKARVDRKKTKRTIAGSKACDADGWYDML
ncbi:hypothetical protein PYCCODRAFT_1123967 [Trametes coccinea BRFM310]|uniref:Uncharacterized protein n=1 Tax=Trametes coccinea (strain BRFM310) TaxID=1353009 RepID=A0A1Y2I8W7_TRAC3|nr:hypothetical protein PYCCODRAFT_1123967 [Trametes coccinea BRFM310]